MPSLMAPFDKLASYYPRIVQLKPTVYQCPQDPNGPQSVSQAMAQFGSGTSCCVQMSHALNLSGVTVLSASNQRSNVYLSSNGFFYLGNVSELEYFLANQCAGYFDGEILHDDLSGDNRSAGDMKNYLQGRQGILLFRDHGYGAHTELWDGQDILQKSIMDQPWCWSQPRILFWDAGPPQWLVNAVASDTTP
jgi:hypothetical protein